MGQHRKISSWFSICWKCAEDATAAKHCCIVCGKAINCDHKPSKTNDPSYSIHGLEYTQAYYTCDNSMVCSEQCASIYDVVPILDAKD